MDEQAKQFLADLQKANAEELKMRILKRVEAILQEHGLQKDCLKEIDIDVSDYLK